MDAAGQGESGTSSGGAGQFFAGLIMTGIGAYLLLNQVEVASSFWNFFGFNAFGLTTLPLLIGVGMLFYNDRSVIGWILTVLGSGIILAAILMSMHIYFRPTSLYNTLIMLLLVAGGIGLMARAAKKRERAETLRGPK